MTWLLLATGFTGGLTLVFVVRWVHQWLVPPRTAAAHFSPKGGCTDAVVQELKRARREVLVQAYTFTSQPIAEALVEAKARGARVQVLLDHANEKDPHSALKWMVEKGLAPLIDRHHPIAHNKVMLIDGHTLLTGSFNFTHQAEAENAENLLILRGERELVERYRKEFESHKAHCQAPGARAEPAPQRKAA